VPPTHVRRSRESACNAPYEVIAARVHGALQTMYLGGGCTGHHAARCAHTRLWSRLPYVQGQGQWPAGRVIKRMQAPSGLPACTRGDPELQHQLLAAHEPPLSECTVQVGTCAARLVWYVEGGHALAWYFVYLRTSSQRMVTWPALLLRRHMCAITVTCRRLCH
jgi:hypothetical protein